MTTKSIKTKAPMIPNLPLAGADSEQARYLIAAMLAAGKDGCQCDACQLLKRFGGEMSQMILKGVTGGGDNNSV